jgi:GNAT superfamily N-acetyltransferase
MDLLVKLYNLPPLKRGIPDGVSIRHAKVPERHLVVSWVKEHFSEYWASEIEFAFSQHPVRCVLAIEKGQIIGFACYDTTFKSFFGPTGVDESCRGRGIGELLLHKALHALRSQGHMYAFIGAAGPVDFYKHSIGAIEIEDSTPGPYQGLLGK